MEEKMISELRYNPLHSLYIHSYILSPGSTPDPVLGTGGIEDQGRQVPGLTELTALPNVKYIPTMKEPYTKENQLIT